MNNNEAEVTSKDGLLWRNGAIIELPEADRVARQHGFDNAEQLVRHLSTTSATAQERKQ